MHCWGLKKHHQRYFWTKSSWPPRVVKTHVVWLVWWKLCVYTFIFYDYSIYLPVSTWCSILSTASAVSDSKFISAKALSSSAHFWKPVLCQWSWFGSTCLTCSSAVLWWALIRYYENVISASSKQLQSRGYKVEDDGVPSHTLQSTFPSFTFCWILPARIWATSSKTSHKKQYWCGYSDHDRIIKISWKILGLKSS